MKKAIIPSILMLSLFIGGCQEKEPEVEVIEKATPVETMQAAVGSIQRELVYAGQVKPVEQIHVMPKLGGRVKRVNYEVGDRVSVNDILFELDDTDIQGSINAASAQYNASLSGVQTARASLDSVSGAQSDSTELQLTTAIKNTQIALENADYLIESANLGLENADIALANAQLALNNISETYNNTKTLYEAGVVPKADFDRVELSYNQALSGLEQATLAKGTAVVAKEQAEAAKNQAAVTNQQAKEQYELFLAKSKSSSINQAQSGVNQASSAAEVSRVALDNAKRTLDDLKIKSPLAGVVTTRNVSQGGMAAPSSLAFTIVNMDTVEIETNVSEELINIISIGTAVPVYIYSISEEPFEGIITSISPAADEMKNTFPVKIEIANPEGLLKPGMFAEVRFVREQNEETFVLARNTVMSDESSKYVFVAENGTAKKYIVETGIDNGKDIEIISGIEEDSMIIVKGQTLVSEGVKIEVVKVITPEDELGEEAEEAEDAEQTDGTEPANETETVE